MRHFGSNWVWFVYSCWGEFLKEATCTCKYGLSSLFYFIIVWSKLIISLQLRILSFYDSNVNKRNSRKMTGHYMHVEEDLVLVWFVTVDFLPRACWLCFCVPFIGLILRD